MKSFHASKIDLLNLSEKQLTQWVNSLGQPGYRAQQLAQWMHQRGVDNFEAMSDLSKRFRAELQTHACITLPQVDLERVASDGVHKWLLRLDDGNRIETVFIPDRERGTLCVSSQVGCTLNCSFCATGKQGFNRNLTLAEIIGQVWLARRLLKDKPQYRLTNVVMMGMGEPLYNFEPVVDAMHWMMHDRAYGLSKYRVTLSTSGVIPMMEKLRLQSDCAVAVSLHAPCNELRDILVPLNKKYSLEQLIPLCRDYYEYSAKRCVTFEYVMIDGVNDGIAEARELIRLLSDVPCKINLIPFNPFDNSGYRRSTATAINIFQNKLIAAGFNTRVRRTRGDDIHSACGQLAGKIRDRTGRNRRWLQKIAVIADSA